VQYGTLLRYPQLQLVSFSSSSSIAHCILASPRRHSASTIHLTSLFDRNGPPSRLGSGAGSDCQIRQEPQPGSEYHSDCCRTRYRYHGVHLPANSKLGYPWFTREFPSLRHLTIAAENHAGADSGVLLLPVTSPAPEDCPHARHSHSPTVFAFCDPILNRRALTHIITLSRPYRPSGRPPPLETLTLRSLIKRAVRDHNPRTV